MVVNSEGGDFDEDDDDGDPDENASDINSPAAPRETATPAAPGTVLKKKREILAENAEARTTDEKRYSHKFAGVKERKGSGRIVCLPPPHRKCALSPGHQRGQAACAQTCLEVCRADFLKKKTHVPYPPPLSPSPPSIPSVSMNAVKRKLAFLCSCGVLNFPLHAQPLTTTTEKFKPTLLTHSPGKIKKKKSCLSPPLPVLF